MKKIHKIHYVITFLIVCGFLFLSTSTSTAAYLTGFQPYDLCTKEMDLTYIDADGDPSTGAWVNGTWYPNETQVVVQHIQSDVRMSADSIQFGYYGTSCGQTAQKGKFVMKFVDVTAPGWIWNNPKTWTERKINKIKWNWSHANECMLNGNNSYVKAMAYEHWNQGNLIDNALLDIYTTGGKVTMESSTGISEIYFTTDYCLTWVLNMHLSANPTQKPEGCEGRCGVYDKGAACQCDAKCEQYGDCCSNYKPVCVESPQPGSCEGRCGEFNSTKSCQCDDKCEQYGDCCSDYIPVCDGPADPQEN